MAIITVLVAAGVWFLTQEGTTLLHDLSRAANRADAWWLAPALAATAVSYGGYALLYQGVARVDGGPRPPLKLALRLTIAIFGASVIATAAGRLGGEYWSLRRMREKPALAWARVLAINTAAWAIVTSLAAIGAIVLLAGGAARAPLGLELAWLAALPLCLPPALYLSAPARRHLAEDRGGRIRRTAASVINALVLLRKLAAARPARNRALAGGLLYWGAELIVLWAALRGFGVDIGYGPLAVGYATGYISTMLPLPAGGVGGVEAASVYALTLVGVPLGPALLAVLVQRVLTYWLPLAVALVGARFLRSLPAELGDVPRAAPAWRVPR